MGQIQWTDLVTCAKHSQVPRPAPKFAVQRPVRMSLAPPAPGTESGTAEEQSGGVAPAPEGAGEPQQQGNAAPNRGVTNSRPAPMSMAGTANFRAHAAACERCTR